MKPALRLLSEAERQHMLADIARVALAVGRDLLPDAELDDLDIGKAPTDPFDDPCPRERLAFLASAWPRLARALAMIETAPPAALQWETREVPFARARRVLPADLRQALRSGNFAPAKPETSALARSLQGHLPQRVREQVAVPTFDTKANRFVKTVLAVWSRDLSDIAALADAVNAPDVARQAHHLRRRIRSFLVRSPWQSLPVLPQAGVLPPSLRTHGAYQRVSETWRMYRKGFVFDWHNPIFTLPARETWVLYEYWCLFQVAQCLRELGYRASVENGFGFAISRSGLTFSLVRGRGASLRFSSPSGSTRPPVVLTYNRFFTQSSKGWYSRSHSMRPDITLEVGNQLILLDAKHKSYNTNIDAESPIASDFTSESEPASLPLVADLNQMHAYRDGLQNTTGTRPTSAWLLYAGSLSAPNAPVIAYPAPTSERPFGGGEIGALLLRPGYEQNGLRTLLRFLLAL